MNQPRPNMGAPGPREREAMGSGRGRESIAPTYDHAETGDRYSVETRVEGRRISFTPMVDPFVTQRVVIGWLDLLRGLWRRRLEVEVLVNGDQEIVEDVMELNADYLGKQGSTRRQEWNAAVERGLGDFAAGAEDGEAA
jgi:hypothetical protein